MSAGTTRGPGTRPVLLCVLTSLTAILQTATVLGGPEGVWVPVQSGSAIERIHVFGLSFDYTATIDYRCRTGVCSTLESVSTDSAQRPPVFFVQLEGVGPTPQFALRWRSGPPCNRAKSDENPLGFWAKAIPAQSGQSQIGPAGRSWCFVRLGTKAPR